MAKICLCLTGTTLEEDLTVLEQYRAYTDLAELRMDFLAPEELPFAGCLPSKTRVPLIMTMRKKQDGGFFGGSEDERLALMLRCTGQARGRRNFAYIDIEGELNAPEFEREIKSRGIRIIRSLHNFGKSDDEAGALVRALMRSGDDIPKIALMSHSVQDVEGVYRAADNLKGQEKIILCMGSAGINTRILADRLGSYLSYTTASPQGKPIHLAAPGQLDPKELEEGYRFRQISGRTKLFGEIGAAPGRLARIKHLNRRFADEKADAVCVPLCPADGIDDEPIGHFLSLASEIGLSGAIVNEPYTETIIPFLEETTEETRQRNRCNTIIKSAFGWRGCWAENTDESAAIFLKTMKRFAPASG